MITYFASVYCLQKITNTNLDVNGKAYICIAKNQPEIIMINDPFWVSLLETLLLKVILLEMIFFISSKNIMAFRD